MQQLGCGCGAKPALGERIVLLNSAAPSTSKMLLIVAALGVAGLAIFGLSNASTPQTSERDREFYAKRHARKKGKSR